MFFFGLLSFGECNPVRGPVQSEFRSPRKAPGFRARPEIFRGLIVVQQPRDVRLGKNGGGVTSTWGCASGGKQRTLRKTVGSLTARPPSLLTDWNSSISGSMVPEK